MQAWLNIQKLISRGNHVNQLRKKNHKVISIDTEKALDKTLKPFLMKTPIKLRTERKACDPEGALPAPQLTAHLTWEADASA